MEITTLLDLEHSIAAPLFAEKTYPWEVLDGIGAFILAYAKTLSSDEYDEKSPGVWVSKTATVYPTAYLTAPCIIDHGAELRHGAFIRGNVIVGKRAVVGNSTELKNVILFNEVQVPHYNYVGDSILGYRAHMGAGSITSNVKSDKSLVSVQTPQGTIATGRKKVGAMLGDRAEIGCNSVLNPGTVVGRDSIVYPVQSVRGTIPAWHILKEGAKLVARRTNTATSP